MAGALIVAIAAVTIVTGILVYCKKRVKSTTPNEVVHYYSVAGMSTSYERFYEYVNREAADYIHPVPSIQTSANAAYGTIMRYVLCIYRYTTNVCITFAVFFKMFPQCCRQNQ